VLDLPSAGWQQSTLDQSFTHVLTVAVPVQQEPLYHSCAVSWSQEYESLFLECAEPLAIGRLATSHHTPLLSGHTPLSPLSPHFSIGRAWSWCRPKKEDWQKKKDRNQRRPGCPRSQAEAVGWWAPVQGPTHCSHTVTHCHGVSLSLHHNLSITRRAWLLEPAVSHCLLVVMPTEERRLAEEEGL